MSSSIVETEKFFISVYKILGIFIGVIQQMISYILLLRVISVYIDRKKKNPVELVRIFIYRTKQFESIHFLGFLIMMLSVLSYLVTLDAVHEFLMR